MLVQTGCVISAFGAYLVAITADTGWSPGIVAVAFAIIQLGNGTISPVTGWACDRFGTRAVAALGTLLTAAGCVMVAHAGSSGGFIGAVVVVSLGCSAAGITPLTVAVVQSLTHRRTLALGLLPSGIALGGLLVPAVVWLLDTAGWRTAFLAVAAVTTVVGLVACVWLPGPAVARRRRVAVAAPGAAVSAVAAPEPGAGPDLDLRAAVRTSAFWLLIAGHGCALVAVGAMNLHLVPLMTHGRGFDLAIAGLAVAGMSVTQLIGQLVTGVVGDRFDKRRLAAGCMALQTAVLVVLAFSSNLVVVFAAAMLHGLGWGLRGPAMNALRADYFGTRAFGTITGWSMGFVSLGMVGGPLLVSVFAQGPGGYPVGFLAATAATVAGLVAFLVVRPPRPREPVTTAAGRGCSAAPESAA
ncbi:MFS transporter [Pseudonocardia sulfidoxydans NBRC 16205]|uniref:MFS transporter n=1 Tax=Pseudonocardia sulfidoxydans NBRC 16205 TaxID=1223511 RepID=A0A511DAX5_9PSEU|nr:MFS transporter [Pseudonocardia sulfidoxydans NBRC 16205]